MKNKLTIEFDDRYQSVKVCLLDETGNGKILLTGTLCGGAAPEVDIKVAKGLLQAMVDSGNAYRQANGYDMEEQP